MNETELNVSLAGRLDTTATQLETELKDSLLVVTKLELDFAN